jgi:sterol desaturase/sphingolipid hydroxylase (fatty acid hydroxylase superfamily)
MAATTHKPDTDEQTGMSRAEYMRASPPLLKPAALDRFTRVHWSVPLIIFVPVVTVLAVLALNEMRVWQAVALFAAGYAIWTLTEYWLHRVVFHFAPDEGVGAKLHFLIHGVHHEHPNDPKRLVMPPSASVPLAALFCLLFWALLGHWWYPVGAGFLGGYLAYDMTHYAVHHHQPKSRVAKRLRELHMRHHFQDSHAGYGVSAPYWDHVFGTASKTKKRTDSAEH